MDDVVTKITKNVSSNNSSGISLPKISFPEKPIINMSKGSKVPDTISPITTISPNIVANKTFFGISLLNILLGITIIMILAILGVNVFLYLAEGTDILGDIIQKIIYLLPESISKTFRLSSIGTATTGEIVSDTLDNVSDSIEGSSEKSKKRKGGENNEDLEEILEEENRRREKKKKKRNEKIKEIYRKQVNENNLKKSVENRDDEGIAKYTDFLPTSSKYKTKKGKLWCYIGNDRGFKSCIKLNESEKCMSGKIFKTKDKCEY